MADGQGDSPVDREKWVFDPKKTWPEGVPPLPEEFRDALRSDDGTVEGRWVGDHDLIGMPFRIGPDVPQNRLEFANLGRYMRRLRVPGDVLAFLGLSRKQRADVERTLAENGEARVRVTVPDDVAQRFFGEPQGFAAEVLIRADEGRPDGGAGGVEGGVGDGQGGA